MYLLQGMGTSVTDSSSDILIIQYLINQQTYICPISYITRAIHHCLHNKIMRAYYDHEQDQEAEQQSQQPAQEEPVGETAALVQMDMEEGLARVTAELHEATYQLKSQETILRRVQRDIQGKVSEAQLTQTIALINAGIHCDPNVIKLLKTRESAIDEEEGKVRASAGAFSRKLNQMSQALSVLLAGQKRLQSRISAVEGDLGMQINQKVGGLQLQLQELRGQASKNAMELTQRVELTSFELGDRVREIQTKLNWKLNDFKNKLDEKITQERVLSIMEDSEKRMATEMKNFQLKSNIDPARIDAIEQQAKADGDFVQRQMAEWRVVIQGLRGEVQRGVVRRQEWANERAAVEKRLLILNGNFSEFYARVVKCEEEEADMKTHINKLLKDSSYWTSELKRINTVLLNIKLSDDFQRMLQEMNPAKVLELQDAVDSVKSEQTSIFREIALAKREISIIQAKSENMGFLTPNITRNKLQKEDIQQALGDFLKDHHFTQKLATLDRQLAEYRHSIDAVSNLSRQVARLQKESDTHHLGFQLRTLEEYVRRQLALLATRTSSHQQPERAPSNPTQNEDPLPLGQARSFSTRKLSHPHKTPIQTHAQLLQIKTARR